MTQKIYFLHLVFHFQTTLAFQLCVIIHDLYNDFSRRHLLVSRLFSNVPNVSHVIILLRIASSDFGHEWRLCLSATR